MFVSYAPEIDMAACGETMAQAKQNLAEVVSINFEEMKKLGTLREFLHQSELELVQDAEEIVRSNKQLLSFESRGIPV